MKKAGKIPHLILETVRLTAIKLGVLPRNFVAAKHIHLRVVNDKALDYGGFGGYVPVNGILEPFICVNLHYMHNSKHVEACIAHEILHIAQVRKGKNAKHDNEFRKNCKTLADALGINYYLVFGYDVPTDATCKAGGKAHEKWLRSFRSEKEKRDKRGYTDTI